MPSPTCPDPKRLSLNEHLYTQTKVSDALRHLVIALSQATKYIQYAIRTTEAGLAGSRNQFGEEQVKLDVLSDELIQRHLCESRLVSTFISEEHCDVVELDDHAPFSVVFDPLDGSSLVDANFSIGSIFGVFEGKDVLGKSPQDQVAAFYALYGPRTLLVYSTGNGVHMFLLNDVGEFILLREYLGVSDSVKNYSPGNLRAVTENDAYRSLLNCWLDEELTLRYSGCMVADIHHILSKGQGVFTNIGGGSYPEGKLRLVFECGPFAYLMEQAGGSASDGSRAILDKTFQSIDQRSSLIIGSKNEVERVCTVLAR